MPLNHTLTVKHLPCRTGQAHAPTQTEHPTPGGADGSNPTKHQQPAFGFTPPLGWDAISRIPGSFLSEVTRLGKVMKTHKFGQAKRGLNHQMFYQQDIDLSNETQ